MNANEKALGPRWAVMRAYHAVPPDSGAARGGPLRLPGQAPVEAHGPSWARHFINSYPLTMNIVNARASFEKNSDEG